jgi:hypothetical protein
LVELLKKLRVAAQRAQPEKLRKRQTLLRIEI